MRLKDIIAKENSSVFLNKDEFADELLIGTNSMNTVEVCGSLQMNEVDNTSCGGVSLQAFSAVLYVKYPIGGTIELNAGQALYINKAPYKVIDFEDVMGLATIHLRRA